MSDFVREIPGAVGSRPPRAWWHLRFDPILLILVILCLGFGLIVLHSAVEGDARAFNNQLLRIVVAVIGMLVLAQIEPGFYRQWAPYAYGGVLFLLVAVLFFDPIKGSRRWIQVAGFGFQPSELAKLVVPMTVAWYLHERPLPPTVRALAWSLCIIGLTMGLIVIEPDLGTSILVGAAGFSVLLLAGMHWRLIGLAAAAAIAATPVIWMGMQDYQKGRVLTLLDPERDPLGAGWNIIQSMTAIGSGGLFGKGRYEGTQSHLDFLPESQTDFIVAVLAEELGLFGVLGLLLIYALIIMRGIVIAIQASDTFSRLLAGSITFTFFVYLFVNVAMVSGLLPVVGVPLPLVSYGGTSIITLLAGFGVLMSIHGHRERFQARL